MASIIEKYEQILAADPKSRIFVELARALLEKGSAARAVEICEHGMEHHPGSILGRVIWGRALLEQGELKGAMDQFEIAIALEPANPYAYNLVGEALIKKDHPREALPVLARAAELSPADHRVQGMLDDAMRRVREAGAGAGSGGEPVAAPAAGTPGDTFERTEPYRPIPAPAAASPESGAPAEAPASPASEAGDEPAPPAEPPAVAPQAAAEPAAGPPAPPPLPRPATTPVPPPIRRGGPRKPSALDFIPGGEPGAAAPSAPARAAAKQAPSAAEAARVAEQYERELREKAAREDAKEKPSWWHRNRFTALGVLVVLVATAGGGVYWLVRERQAAASALQAADRARAGLARDTRAALGTALDVLLAARERSASDPAVASLAAQVASMLAAEHEEPRARDLLPKLAADGRAAEGALAARWALAATPAERKAAEDALLAAEPTGAPLLQALAGEILVARGEKDSGRGRLEIAAKATPPLLRAVVDLGDLALADGDAEAAIASYAQAIAAVPTHPRAVAGAAEARLALGRDLDASLKEIAAVDADPGSAPPAADRLRFEIDAARVLAATGDPAAAAERLKKAAEAMGKSVRLSAALAEIHLASCAWDRAEAEAKRVVDLDPKAAEPRVLLARARIGKRDWAGALAATERADGRAAHLVRAIARYQRGELDKARDELKETQHDGKLTAEGATWYALTDLALKRTDKAAALLEKLTSAPSAPALAFVALGKVRAVEGKPDEAEKAWRAAVERDPRLPEAQSALGQHLLAQGKGADAVEPLSRAVALDGTRLDDRTALAQARVAAGDPARARSDLDAVLAARPKDPDALRVLASALLAEKTWGEARKAAEKAAAAAPRDARPLVIAARAALAVGERGEALKLAGRAAKLAGKGPVAEEAAAVAAEASGRKK